MNTNDSEIEKRLHAVATALASMTTDMPNVLGSTVEIVAPLRELVTPGIHVGFKGPWNEKLKAEWLAGQILSIVDEGAWFAMNSILNRTLTEFDDQRQTA